MNAGPLAETLVKEPNDADQVATETHESFLHQLGAARTAVAKADPEAMRALSGALRRDQRV